MFSGQWSGITWPGSSDAVRDPDTGVEEETLKTVGRASVTVPEGFVSRRFREVVGVSCEY